MNPAFSVVLFTVVTGVAQGLVVALALAVLVGIPMSADLLSHGLIGVVGLLVTGLGASFAHLGRPERAWRAVTKWRTSWLSREVIVLPICIATLGLWWIGLHRSNDTIFVRRVMPLAALVAVVSLWYCTAMIYACLRFIEEWAHPLTLVNFVLIGLSSGFILACTLAALAGEQAFLAMSGPVAIALTLMAWASRMMAFRRNARIRHRSTLQTATGIRSTRVVQTSMGMSAGSFNTREFFHRASPLAFRCVWLSAICLAFVAPALAMSFAWFGPYNVGWVAAFVIQMPGLVADRWYFFAQAKHPQNLYYQVVS